MTNEECIKMLKSKLDGNTDTSYEWCECVRLAIKALEQQRWIPVSEKLPEKNIEVLVTTKWDGITIGEMLGNNDWLIYEGTTYADNDDIKAWMPLPSSYQGESEE